MIRAEYLSECEERWYGQALRDAIRNWSDWEQLQPTLIKALTDFHRDPMLEDATGKCHNPDGSLTSFLWSLQETLQPDKSCLLPLLDFEERHQKVFLRRGLIVYCSMILRQLEADQVTDAEMCREVLQLAGTLDP